MIFEFVYKKLYAMRKLFILIVAVVVMSSCSATKQATSSKSEARKEKKLAEQAMIKDAVESKRYIIKLDRIFPSYGRIISLVPKENYIIIDKERAVINAAYLGRQYDIRPIAAINIRGRSEKYVITNNTSKGSYEIKMKVTNGGSNTFDLYLTISKNGDCNASVTSLKIDNIRYSGTLVPIPEKFDPSGKEVEGNAI